MKEKERPILYISLALNLILVVLLILSYTREPEPTPIAALPETADVPLSTAPITPTSTYTPTPEPEAEASDTPLPSSTATAPPTATETPANTPTPTVPPSPTATETPVPTPLPTPTPSPTPIPQPDWLIYINTFRSLIGVEVVADNGDWSQGSLLHSVYMVNTGDITHEPDTTSQWYTEAGRLAAKYGNIAATEYSQATYVWAINYWMSAPFHALPILDPELTAVGFGFFSNPSQMNSGNLGAVNVAATLDIQRGIVSPALEILQFPISFPPDGGETWVLKHDLYEYPNPLTSCPGYSRPTGAPIIIQTGTGTGRPNINSFLFTENGVAAAACMFDETTYTNSDAFAQDIGRKILDPRDAVVIIPRNPLVVGSTYAVTITVDGTPYTTQFTAVAPP